MKQLMKVIGMKLVRSGGLDKGLVELRLRPKDMVKEKPPGFMKLASGGMEGMLQAAQGLQEFDTIVFVSLRFWILTLKNQPLGDVYLDIELAELPEDIAKRKLGI